MILLESNTAIVTIPLILALVIGFITVRNSSCGKVMFSQVCVCPQGGGVHLLGRHPPCQADTPLLPGRSPPGRHTPCQADLSPPRWLLQRTERILLECILVCCRFGFPLSFSVVSIWCEDSVVIRIRSVVSLNPHSHCALSIVLKELFTRCDCEFCNRDEWVVGD